MSASRNPRNRGLLVTAATLLGGALLVTGVAVPGAQAATPERAASAVVQVQDGHLHNTSIGTYLRIANASNESITVQLNGNYKVNEVVKPGDHIDCKGNGTDDDVSGNITFADGSSLPVYAHNPTFSESYAQIAGHKWHGSGGQTIDGKQFHAEWKGNWTDAGGDTWKEWHLTFQGRG